MKILVINPNTSVEMSKTIDSSAKKCASPGTEITTVSPADGPEFLANAYDESLQVPKILDLIEKNLNDYGVFIIACGADPGLAACRIVTKNVIGIAEAAIMTACAVAKRFSCLCTTEAGPLFVASQVHSYRVDLSRLASTRIVGSGASDEIVRKRHKMFDVYCQVGQKCVVEDGADALVLTCAGMSDLKERLEECLKVPVFSGVVSAVKIAEQLSTL